MFSAVNCVEIGYRGQHTFAHMRSSGRNKAFVAAIAVAERFQSQSAQRSSLETVRLTPFLSFAMIERCIERYLQK
jgi:hypothetical protein